MANHPIERPEIGTMSASAVAPLANEKFAPTLRHMETSLQEKEVPQSEGATGKQTGCDPERYRNGRNRRGRGT